jgi:DNA-binding GntR family transcriptional regulator
MASRRGKRSSRGRGRDGQFGLAHRVYHTIKKRILSCEIPPVARLRDQTLAKQLGVSRTPVREALMALTREGLVEIFPRSKTRVCMFTEHDLEEIFDLRIALETLAIQEGMERFCGEEIRSLRSAYSKG